MAHEFDFLPLDFLFLPIDLFLTDESAVCCQKTELSKSFILLLECGPKNAWHTLLPAARRHLFWLGFVMLGDEEELFPFRSLAKTGQELRTWNRAKKTTIYQDF